MIVNRYLARVFDQIGLSSKHVLVYQSLLIKPSTTPLVLARETKLNRSSLYRYLEDLRAKGLVELVLGDKSSKYIANPNGLNQYLVEEETRVLKLKETIPSLVSELSKTYSSQANESEVRYFKGVEGLKQMLWNVIASGKEYVGLGYQNWNTSVGKSFAERLRKKNIETGAKTREISNDLDDGFGYTALGSEYQKMYHHHSIDPKILDIKHDTYVYGDVFAYYYHYAGEYFGVEIHNPEIARTEKQMFEILWKMTDKK